ncbi:YodC family protein [Pseudomonas soli]|jgi:uncharacterized protein YodC (DUF2158 family)|uniref:YodC family protein n=1 Tax=Pseudomonas soli TaxID=1306993 RepID=A0AAJ5MHU9_9PSED|nr:YodC family protein [Pseudomonas soli]UXZ43591.1 YodC family protein [Pseudomonas soli]
MTEIVKGGVVVLKSGGPAMTVQEVGSYTGYGITNGAKCIWFDKDKKYEDIFDLEVLKAIDLDE